MGGYGTLITSIKHPEMFVACAAFSAAVLSDDEVLAETQQQWDKVFGPAFGAKAKGNERLTDHLKENSPLRILRQAGAADALKGVRLYIDCGDDDFLYKGNALLHIALRELKIPHEYRVRDGGHTWSYWRSGLPDALKFIGVSFHQP